MTFNLFASRLCLLTFEDSKGDFAYTNWPSDWVKRMPLPEPASWNRVPNTYESVCDWAVVCEDPSYRERARSQIILYKDLLTSQSQKFTPVTIHLQGFVKDLNVNVFGDWDRCVITSSVFITCCLTDYQIA